MCNAFYLIDLNTGNINHALPFLMRFLLTFPQFPIGCSVNTALEELKQNVVERS
jgi:hypothetical protein